MPGEELSRCGHHGAGQWSKVGHHQEDEELAKDAAHSNQRQMGPGLWMADGEVQELLGLA